MPAMSRWYNDEKTIYLSEVEGEWTLDEFYTSYMATIENIRKVNHPVVAISDMTKSAAPPTRFLSTGRFMANHRVAHVRSTIIVGMTPLGQMLLNVLMRTFASQRDVRVVKTQPEAIELAYKILSESPQDNST